MATELEAAGEVVEPHPGPGPPFSGATIPTPRSGDTGQSAYRIVIIVGRISLVLTSHHFICQDNFNCHGWIPLNLL